MDHELEFRGKVCEGWDEVVICSRISTPLVPETRPFAPEDNDNSSYGFRLGAFEFDILLFLRTRQ